MLSPGDCLTASDTAELRELVAEAAGSGSALEVSSGGSKRDVGKPDREVAIVDLSAWEGVVDYEPSELVLTVRPATPLSAIETMLEQNGQMLAFEPWDHGPMFGREAGSATIGGVVAAGVAGPRRVSAGGVRDHLLGFAAVSGRGEDFKAGGKVVKNVTGYDLSKVMSGSWGQLAIMTELSLKVVPRPRCTRTVAIYGLDPEAGVETMARAMGSRTVPVAAAYRPASAEHEAMALMRLEGFAESVEVRAEQLAEMAGDLGFATQLSEAEATNLWADVREARQFACAEALWRVQLAPSSAAAFTRKMDGTGARWFVDWAGALLWVGGEASLDVRGMAAHHGGHAMLVRAPATMRAQQPIRHPEPNAVAALSGRIKAAFDPAGIFSPSRFG